MPQTLDEILSRLNGLPENEKALIASQVLERTKNEIWMPNIGPQPQYRTAGMIAKMTDEEAVDAIRDFEGGVIDNPDLARNLLKKKYILPTILPPPIGAETTAPAVRLPR